MVVVMLMMIMMMNDDGDKDDTAGERGALTGQTSQAWLVVG